MFRFMPATTPNGWKKIAIVVAKLIIDGQNLGSRSFSVPICDQHGMHRGVTSYQLPPRPGTSPLDFSATHFDNVFLPYSALLGEEVYEVNNRNAWWQEVARLPIGTLGISLPMVSGLKFSVFIAGKYAQHRKVKGQSKTPMPIISFGTQQVAILEALSTAYVMDALMPVMTKSFQAQRKSFATQHAISTIFKTTVVRHSLHFSALLAERCGAQGTLEPNFMLRFEQDVRGGAIAEGDIQVLSIRLFSQLIQGLIPDFEVLSAFPDSLLHQRAIEKLERHTKTLKTLPGGHRSEEFNKFLLPHAEDTVTAIGHALAYEAALEADVDKSLLDMYVVSIMGRDPVWFVQNGGFESCEHIDRRRSEVVSAVLPRIDQYLDGLDVNRYVTSPLVTPKAWEEYLPSLPKFS